MDCIRYLFPRKLESGRRADLWNHLWYFRCTGIFVRAMGTSSVPSELFSALPYILVIVLTVCRKQFNVPAKLGANYVKED